ncbi:unnamed protein product, partial [Urochloa humidicola]
RVKSPEAVASSLSVPHRRPPLRQRRRSIPRRFPASKHSPADSASTEHGSWDSLVAACRSARMRLRPGRLGEVLTVAAVLFTSAALSASLVAVTDESSSSPSPVPRHDYEDALHKSLLYFEAHRSGRLTHGQRVSWRDHSGLTDGLEQGVHWN